MPVMIVMSDWNRFRDAARVVRRTIPSPGRARPRVRGTERDQGGRVSLWIPKTFIIPDRPDALMSGSSALMREIRRLTDRQPVPSRTSFIRYRRPVSMPTPFRLTYARVTPRIRSQADGPFPGPGNGRGGPSAYFNFEEYQ